MIDYFALALAHGLIALAVIRLLGNDALDREPVPPEEREPQDDTENRPAKSRRRTRSRRA